MHLRNWLLNSVCPMKNHSYILVFIFFISCATKITNPNLVIYPGVNEWLPVITYNYHNDDKDFIDFNGDYMRIKLNDSISISTITMFSFNTHEISFSIKRDKENFKYLDPKNMKVISTTHGEMDLDALTSFHKQINFKKIIEASDRKEAISKISNDTIKIWIEDKELQFISPITN